MSTNLTLEALLEKVEELVRSGPGMARREPAHVAAFELNLAEEETSEAPTAAAAATPRALSFDSAPIESEEKTERERIEGEALSSYRHSRDKTHFERYAEANMHNEKKLCAAMNRTRAALGAAVVEGFQMVEFHSFEDVAKHGLFYLLDQTSGAAPLTLRYADFPAYFLLMLLHHEATPPAPESSCYSISPPPSPPLSASNAIRGGCSARNNSHNNSNSVKLHLSQVHKDTSILQILQLFVQVAGVVPLEIDTNHGGKSTGVFFIRVADAATADRCINAIGQRNVIQDCAAWRVAKTPMQKALLQFMCASGERVLDAAGNTIRSNSDCRFQTLPYKAVSLSLFAPGLSSGGAAAAAAVATTPQRQQQQRQQHSLSPGSSGPTSRTATPPHYSSLNSHDGRNFFSLPPPPPPKPSPSAPFLPPPTMFPGIMTGPTMHQRQQFLQYQQQRQQQQWSYFQHPHFYQQQHQQQQQYFAFAQHGFGLVPPAPMIGSAGPAAATAASSSPAAAAPLDKHAATRKMSAANANTYVLF